MIVTTRVLNMIASTKELCIVYVQCAYYSVLVKRLFVLFVCLFDLFSYHEKADEALYESA